MKLKTMGIICIGLALALFVLGCQFDGSAEVDADSIEVVDAAERIELPEPGDEGQVLDEEQEFYQPGEAALFCGGPCGESDPYGSYQCCSGKTCMEASFPEAGDDPPDRCCYSMPYGYWGYPFESQVCITHTSCYREDGAQLHPGNNRKCGDWDDPRCSPSEGVWCDGVGDLGCDTAQGPWFNVGQDWECGTPDDVPL